MATAIGQARSAKVKATAIDGGPTRTNQSGRALSATRRETEMNRKEKPLAASKRRITAAGGVNQSIKKAGERRKGLFHTCNSLAPLVGLVVNSSLGSWHRCLKER